MTVQSLRILVTGGAGYIGSHACKALSRAGHVPVTYDNLSKGHRWAVKWGPLEEGDILDRPRLDDVIARHRPDAIMHFAALAYVGESVGQPGAYYRTNVSGTLNLLEAARDRGIGHIVFSSSCATYGTPALQPITEETPQVPINPYGASKLMGERMLQDFGAAHGIRSVSLRYFNAAGADPEGETGELHDPETHLIPLVLDAAAGKRTHVSVFGTDYPTPDGTCVRDYIHVTDLAHAHVLALECLARGAASNVFNLGTGRGFSVDEIIAAAERLTGRRIPVVRSGRREGDPPRLVSDAAKASAELGWTPRFSDLDSIITTAWAWHQRQQAAAVAG